MFDYVRIRIDPVSLIQNKNKKDLYCGMLAQSKSCEAREIAIAR
jgi:hypothetical protein